MKSTVATISNFVHNRKANWRGRGSGRNWIDQRGLAMRQMNRSPLQRQPDGPKIPPNLCVEGIEVYADGEYMYCKGTVRSQGSRARSSFVVAVEWLDENLQALNTDWKRIEMQPDGKTVPLFADTVSPFVVKAPLDRRVKLVNAYAFAGNN